jgi:tetratricopeptide (TPR) repeat protein
MDEPPVDEEPGEFMVQPEWTAMLEEALAEGRSDHWLSWYHLGVARWAAGDRAGAEQAWTTSVERTPSAWALRNLAIAAELRGDTDASLDMASKAIRLKQTEPALVHQVCAGLLAARRYRELYDLIADLPQISRELPRVRLAKASAALALGELDEVDAFFERPLDVVDIREGELSLSEMWFDLQAAKAAKEEDVPLDDALKQRVRRECRPPEAIDFRMSE